MAINKKSTKSRVLGLASSRRRLNSSKTVDEVTYYSLGDVESVVAAVLSEVSSDPTVGITLEAADTGVILNCVTENGDEYAVDVDLESEDAAVAGEDSPAGDVNASRRRMNSSRKKPRDRYFAVPLTDHKLMAKIESDDATDKQIVAAMKRAGYEIDGASMGAYSPDKYCTLTWVDDEDGGYLEG